MFYNLLFCLLLWITFFATSDASAFPTPSPSIRPTISPSQRPTYEPFLGGLFPGGVQYNSIPANNFTVCYSALYSAYTKSTDIQNCCNRFPVLLVAGKSATSTSSFIVGAYGLSSVICSQTLLNKPVQSNGVYWYFKPGSSNGFAASATINQNTADVVTGPDRLSWHLDQNVGGYRIGDITNLNSNNGYYKMIYGYSPDNITIPSMIPTAMPTAIPSRVPTIRATTPPPTLRPTAGPTTRVPTAGPTTRVPTIAPSARPSIAPTTRVPTIAPSARPSIAPTLNPTYMFMGGKIPAGVQYNGVPGSGFTVCYMATYATFTKASDLQKCCNQFPILLVAGQSSSATSSFLLGAYGPSSAICTPTAVNSPVQSNGVYWYFKSGLSSGFAASGTISQSSADTIAGSDRLSWHLDQSFGGYRIGDILGLNSNTMYYKAIYGYSSNNISFVASPTLAPTRSPSIASSRAPTPNPTFMPLTGDKYPGGVQFHGVPGPGFTVCYSAPYSGWTKASDIQNCCNQFPVLLVAGQPSASPSFIVGAYGLSSVICSQTALNSPVQNNGVYWYFRPGVSSGFAASATINQNSADVVTGPDRLSWHLDQNVGGYRIGDITNLNSDGTYYKVIYGYSDPNISFPSAVPSITPTPVRFPTFAPFGNSNPTARPTLRPSTRVPSRAPTVTPTRIPTRAPTLTTTFFDVDANMMVQNVSNLDSLSLSDDGTIVLRSSLSQATNVPLSSISFVSLDSSSAGRRFLTSIWRTASSQNDVYFKFKISLSTTGGTSKAYEITNKLQQRLTVIANNGTLSEIIQKTSQTYGSTQFQSVSVPSIALSAPMIRTSSPTNAPTFFPADDGNDGFSFGGLGPEISLVIVIIGAIAALFAACGIGYSCVYFICRSPTRAARAEVVGDIEMPVIDLDLIVEVPAEEIQPSAPPMIVEVEVLSWEDEVMQGINQTWQSGDPAIFPLHTILQLTDSWSSDLIIGAGRFGKVYRHHPACFPQRTFPTGLCGLAIKHIDTSITVTDPSNQAHANITPWNSLLREIKILSSFRHPNIIRLLGYCCEDIHQQGDDGTQNMVSQQLCLVYELGALGDLHQCLSQEATRRSLPWTIRIRIALGIVSALNFLHCHKPGHPAYHRDIKSANIVLTADYTPKLIDCGLAKYEATEEEKARGFGMTLGNTILGQRFGSIGYMCPHYAKSGSYDTKSEVYSFGIVLLELITGCVQGMIDPATGQRQFLEDEIEGSEGCALHVDPVAGNWEVACAAQLLEIGRQCVTHYAKRIDKMVTILRWLRQLEDMYCHHGEADESTMAVSEQVEQLRQQWQEEIARTNAIEEKIRQENELHNNQAEPSAPPTPPPTIVRECCVCFDDVVLHTSSSAETSSATSPGGIECSSKAHHFLCKGCFHEQFQTQMHPVHRSTFAERRGKIVCIFCFTAYPEGLIATNTPLDVYAKYRQLCQEISTASSTHH